MAITREIEGMMVDRFGRDSIIALATVDQGSPRVRNVDAYYDCGCFYVLTHAQSSKMRQIALNPAVAIAGEWFTARGHGVNLGSFCDPANAAIAARMREVFAAWIDNGHSDLEDAETCILRLELTEGVLFSHGVRYEIDFAV